MFLLPALITFGIWQAQFALGNLETFPTEKKTPDRDCAAVISIFSMFRMSRINCRASDVPFASLSCHSSSPFWVIVQCSVEFQVYGCLNVSVCLYQERILGLYNHFSICVRYIYTLWQPEVLLCIPPCHILSLSLASLLMVDTALLRTLRVYYIFKSRNDEKFSMHQRTLNSNRWSVNLLFFNRQRTHIKSLLKCILSW